jgi:bifunctional non-homologous end joining protein LigD
VRYQPMLVTPAQALPRVGEWRYELKVDGHRAMGEAEPDNADLFTRQGRKVTDKYPEIAEQLSEAVGEHSAVFDGEMVGVKANGAHSRQELSRRRPRAVYYIFDLLEIDHEPIMARELSFRRKRLKKLLTEQPNIRLLKSFSDGNDLWVATRDLGLEGIVAKRQDSLYVPGYRSKNWRKLVIEPSDERRREREAR